MFGACQYPSAECNFSKAVLLVSIQKKVVELGISIGWLPTPQPPYPDGEGSHSLCKKTKYACATYTTWPAPLDESWQCTQAATRDALVTSMRKSPVLRPALQATPSTSTDSRYWRAGNAGVGVNSSIGVSAMERPGQETQNQNLSENISCFPKIKNPLKAQCVRIGRIY